MANNRRPVRRHRTPVTDRASQEFLLDKIQEVNDRGEYARFHIEKNGLYSPYQLPLTNANIKESLNALEAAGRVGVHIDRRHPWDLFAVVSEESPDSLAGNLSLLAPDDLGSPKDGEVTE
jgi:hypothetical protein